MILLFTFSLVIFCVVIFEDLENRNAFFNNGPFFGKHNEFYAVMVSLLRPSYNHNFFFSSLRHTPKSAHASL